MFVIICGNFSGEKNVFSSSIFQYCSIFEKKENQLNVCSFWFLNSMSATVNNYIYKLDDETSEMNEHKRE